MKFIPDALGRKIGEQGLLASEKAPKMLFVGGVVGMVGSTVLACRATLKLDAVLTDIENNKQTAEEAKELVDAGRVPEDTTYTDSEYRRDLAIISVRGVGSIAKLYAPAVLLGGASVLALTKSHSILKDRNLALTAAYAAVDSAFNRYRERVIDRYGEDADRELRFDYEEVDVLNEETGEVTKELQVVGAPGSRYSRFYDEDSSRNWSESPDINLMFLRNVQNYMNDRLRIHGHVFLNEVYTELGLSHTKAGAIVGWRWNKDSGDDFIDFGIWEGTKEVVNEFFNGREGSILLDFNVDGVIYDKIEEGL
jgi:Family of unknown function (DUF6353)